MSEGIYSMVFNRHNEKEKKSNVAKYCSLMMSTFTFQSQLNFSRTKFSILTSISQATNQRNQNMVDP